MGIVNKRNAIVGWIAVKVGKRVVKKKAQGRGPGASAPAAPPRARSQRSAARSSSGAASAAPARRPVSDSLFRRAIAELVPYEPGKPVEEVQRELGLERVVKLASNEGPFPPFPAALAAIERSAHDLNRYPDGGVWALRSALAERHGVSFEEVIVGAGADGVIDLLSQATLDPGDEIVCGWPSFPSYVLDAAKLGAVARKVPLRDHTLRPRRAARGDRPAHEARLRLPSEQPDRHRERHATSSRRSSTAFPSTCSSCSTRPTSSTSTTPTMPTAIAEHFRNGRRVVVLRTFSKIYGLAGLRVGYARRAEGRRRRDEQGAPRIRRHARPRRPPRSRASTTTARSRAGGRENARGRAQLEAAVRAHGLEPAGPALGNFVFVEVGEGRAVFERLLREGVIVRPLDGFGAPGAIRVTVGTSGGELLLRGALGHVFSGVA